MYDNTTALITFETSSPQALKSAGTVKFENECKWKPTTAGARVKMPRYNNVTFLLVRTPIW